MPKIALHRQSRWSSLNAPEEFVFPGFNALWIVGRNPRRLRRYHAALRDAGHNHSFREMNTPQLTGANFSLPNETLRLPKYRPPLTLQRVQFSLLALVAARFSLISGTHIFCQVVVVGSLAGGCGSSLDTPKRFFTRSRNCWNVT
jgi:hypothetical protein